MKKIFEMPLETWNHTLVSDIIKKGDDIYYSVYASSGEENLFSRNDKIDCEENGIYRIDVRDRKFIKVSNDCGFKMMCLNDQLYVAERFFGWISLKECEIKK